MAVAATLTISGTKSGTPTGTDIIGPLTITNNTSVANDSATALSSGNNSVSVPTGAVGVIIQPPASNTILVTLKGVNGDTGVGLNKTLPTVLELDTTQTSFVLNAASPVTVQLNFF